VKENMQELQLFDVAFIVLYRVYSIAHPRILSNPAKLNELCVKELKPHLKSKKCHRFKSHLRKLINEGRGNINIHKKLEALVITAAQAERRQAGQLNDIAEFWDWTQSIERDLKIGVVAASQNDITTAIHRGRANILLIDVDDITHHCFGGENESTLISPMLITLFHARPFEIKERLCQSDAFNIKAKIVSGRIDLFLAPKCHDLNNPRSFHKLMIQQARHYDIEHSGSERLLQFYDDIERLGFNLSYYSRDEAVSNLSVFVYQCQDFESFCHGEQIEPFDVEFVMDNKNLLDQLMEYLKRTELFLVYTNIVQSTQDGHGQNMFVLSARLNPSYYENCTSLLPDYCKY
jgi:hypothetical protein